MAAQRKRRRPAAADDLAVPDKAQAPPEAEKGTDPDRLAESVATIRSKLAGDDKAKGTRRKKATPKVENATPRPALIVMDEGLFWDAYVGT